MRMKFCHTNLFFLSFLLMACLFEGCHEKKAASEIPPVEVTVEKVEPQTVPAVFEFVGVTQSSHEVEIRARVTGYLEEIAYLEGSFVHKGDVLFQLDPRPFQAALAKEKAQVAKEEAVLWQAQRAVKRFKPLFG
jgi:membrane fusion protein (multidrug efflux system)